MVKGVTMRPVGVADIAGEQPGFGVAQVAAERPLVVETMANALEMLAVVPAQPVAEMIPGAFAKGIAADP